MPDENSRLCWAPRGADGLPIELPGVSYGIVNDEEIARRRAELSAGVAAAEKVAETRYAQERAKYDSSDTPAERTLSPAYLDAVTPEHLKHLKPQVRPFCETYAIDDALAAERRRQQMDPAHDQGPFIDISPRASDRTAPTIWFDTSHKDEPVVFLDSPAAHGEAASSDGKPLTVHELMYGRPATLSVNGETVGVTDMSLAVEEPAVSYLFEPLSMDPGRVSIQGTVTVEYIDPALYRHFTRQQIDDMLQRRAAERYDHPVVRELKWAVHNLIAHPLSEITHWLGFLHPKIRDAGLWLHDITVPKHAPNTGRG